MDSFKDVLEAAQAYCKTQMAEPTYNLYIDGLEPISFEDSSHITLSVRNDFICKIVTDRYLGLLKEAFKTVLGFDVDITLVVPSTPPHEVVLAQQYEANPASPQGNYEFTFENFIKGPSNQFAFAAAQAVAANPSGAYNPLFIYGGSGLGKTHLLTAIQTEIKRTHPDFVIMYVTCEQFTNELIAAIRAGSTEDFRMKYRVADLLLVDDIQFIAGKESTQEEFFHTFNSLHDAHKQIVIASDRPAKEIKSLEERLRTRFEWGLTADVQPPDFETRVAIVKRKAELLHLDLPEDVAEFIANHLKNNIRQLEGTVKKMKAYYLLNGDALNLSTAQMAVSRIGLSILLLLLPKEESDGRAGKIERGAHTVLHVALVGVVDQVAVVDEERKRRRVDARLGHVVHAQAALAVHHGMTKLAQVGEERVEARGADLLRARLLGGVDHAPDLLDAAASQGRDAQVLGPGSHDAQTAVDGLHAGLALAVVVEQVPLVEQYHDGAAALDGEAHDLLILLGDAHGGVDDEQRHVGAVDGAQAADHGVVLDVLVHGTLLANARGVDHAVVLAVALDDGVDGVARGAGDVGHDGAVGAQDAVEQRRLTGVGAADDGDVQRVGELIGDLVLFLGKQGHDIVEQVARAVAVHGGNGDGIAEA